MIKKIVSVLALTAVISMSAVAALSVVPHAHGNDLNHSQHETCPIYQFGLHHTQADYCTVQVVTALFLFFGCIVFKIDKPSNFFRVFASLRAPPAIP